MRFIALYGAVLLAALTGCSMSPLRVALPQGSTVVLINAMEPGMTNAHMGFTVFEKYEEIIENDWNIPAYTEEFVRDQLSSHGYHLVSIKVDKEKLAQLKDGAYLAPGHNNFRIRSESSGWLQETLNSNGGAALIVLRNFRRNFGTSSTMYGGYGIVTLGIKSENAALYANVRADVFSGDPLINMDGVSLWNRHCTIGMTTESFNVDDLRTLDANDLLPYRDELEGIIRTRITQDLTASGLMSGTVVRCSANHL